MELGWWVYPLYENTGSWSPAHPTKTNVRKFVASWHPMTSSHPIAAASTSMAGAASGECSEKKKLRPCHMEETALPAAESRFKGGRHGGFQLGNKRWAPPKKKALTVYCIHVVLFGAPKKMAENMGFAGFFQTPKVSGVRRPYLQLVTGPTA